jgi:hypothetical protein
MNTSSSGEIKWGVLAATAMVLVSLIPQIHLWCVRGTDWNGTYAPIQGDEYLYSAYVNALIDGRPRLNDPFAGRDSTPESPLPESTFSIQFIPAYVISSLARAFGASASTAFIVLVGTTGLLASLSVFWLLTSVTGNGRLAAVGVLLVLCCGALAGAHGLVGILLNHKGTAFMPFLRRYQPAAVFPLFFVFCGLVWRALISENKHRARPHSMFAGLTLGVLVFSYLYLWAAVAAWLACLAVLWLYFRPSAERRHSLEVFTIIGAIAIFALIPYVNLVSHRAASSDYLVTLVLTHQLDLFHTPEIIGSFILVALVFAVKRGKVKRFEPRLIFAASFALLPLVLFNQQVLTGRSMQPLHFDHFVANYAVLVSLVIATALFWRHIPNRTLLWTAVLCLSWGAIEIGLPALARPTEVVDDQMIPVLRRLKELSTQDGTLTGLRKEGKTSGVVFSPHFAVMRLLPTWTSQGTLLAVSSLDFGTASKKEQKELLYLYLYYCQTDAVHLRELLNERTDDPSLNFYTTGIVFGFDRTFSTLSLLSKPIQQDEIEEEVRAYQAYADAFSREKVLQHPLNYVVTRVGPDLSHIDRWYERDAGERFGVYTLYRLNLRT